VVGSADGGVLRFSWFYRPQVHRGETVGRVAGEFAEALRRIARDCRGSR
jgi:hypothetical protein